MGFGERLNDKGAKHRGRASAKATIRVTIMGTSKNLFFYYAQAFSTRNDRRKHQRIQRIRLRLHESPATRNSSLS